MGLMDLKSFHGASGPRGLPVRDFVGMVCKQGPGFVSKYLVLDRCGIHGSMDTA